MKRHWLLGISLVSALALNGCQWAPSAHAQEASATPAPGPQLASQLAVVEADKLIREHPDYSRLKEMEDEIDRVSKEIQEIPEEEIRKGRKIAQDAMEKALEQAKGEMQAEQAQIQGEMQGLAAALQTQMSAELSEYKAQLDKKIKDMVEKERRNNPLTPTGQDTGNAEMNEYRRNLQLIGARTLAARRLELEKANQAQLAAERNRLDQQIAAYEDQVAARYQEEKLNLQLKMQNGPGEEEEKVTRERLNAIDDEIAAAKAAKRTEIESAMDSFRTKLEAEHSSQVASHKQRIESEMMEKLRQKATGGRPAAMPAPSEEVRKTITEAQAAIATQVAARKAELEGRMKGKEAEARARLQAKQKEIGARLEELNAQLRKRFEDREKFLSKDAKTKLAAARKRLEKVQAERRQVYDKLIAEIGQSVGKVADKKKIPCVIGQFVVNNDLEDLTDLSMVEVKQIGHR